MTRPDLDALAALLERATPGPWDLGEFDEQGGYDCMTSGISCGPASIDGKTYGERYMEPLPPAAQMRMIADAALIVAAVNALPALIARVRELEQERDEARAERDALREVVRAADAVRTLQFDDLWEVREYDRARAAWKDEV